MKFALFFMGEYANMVAASAMMVTLFFGGWTLPFAGLDQPATTAWKGSGAHRDFSGKMLLFMVVIIWVRWMWPRFRYDQLMDLGWRRFVPLALANIFVTALVSAVDNRNKMIVKRKELSFWERLYLPALFGGLKVTLRHFRKTLFKGQTAAKEVDRCNYPEDEVGGAQGYRGAPYLVKDQEGRTKCVSCQLCEFVCPAQSHRIIPPGPEGRPRPATWKRRRKEFEINMLRCIFCGYCQEVCPEEAIFLMKDYSLTGESREEMIYNKEKLLALGGVHHDQIRKWKQKTGSKPNSGDAPVRLTEYACTDLFILHFRGADALVSAFSRHRQSVQPQSGHERDVSRPHHRVDGGVVRAAARLLSRGRSDPRLRRRGHGAVPVRDHAARSQRRGTPQDQKSSVWSTG